MFSVLFEEVPLELYPFKNSPVKLNILINLDIPESVKKIHAVDNVAGRIQCHVP